MLELLDIALAELPELLASSETWTGLQIDYHPPFVDRAWRPWRHCRLSIHRIYPCAREDALFHPHPWPSAMRLLSGRYEMNLGYGAGTNAPPVTARVIATAGTRYAMIHRDAWHDVRPLDGPALTVMLSGPPWQRAMPVEPTVPQRVLPPAALADLLADARVALRALA
jgi:hypothetical protein